MEKKTLTNRNDERFTADAHRKGGSETCPCYRAEIEAALWIVRQAALLARRIQAEMIFPHSDRAGRSKQAGARRSDDAGIGGQRPTVHPPYPPEQAGYTSLGAISKNDLSPVTVADFAIQALVSHWLMEAFPTDPLVAEEDSSALRDSPLLDQVTGFVSSLVQADARWLAHIMRPYPRLFAIGSTAAMRLWRQEGQV